MKIITILMPAVIMLWAVRVSAVEPGKESQVSKAAPENATTPAAGPAAAHPAQGVPARETTGKTPAVRLTGVLESGFLAVLSHSVQFSNDGTVFSYRREGGQNVLFQVYRASAELEIERRHKLLFLYQPLSLRTQVSLDRNLRVDGLDFPAGTTVNLVYDFPFYRLSYLYDLGLDGVEELSLGLSLQIRNATISFSSEDGSLFRDNRDVGPVPLLKARGRLRFGSVFWTGFEIDWIYAPVSYLNGSDTAVTGALLDASLRGGVSFRQAEAFFNIRYLSGGATGTSDDTGPGDGFVSNWLDFLTVTLGLTISI